MGFIVAITLCYKLSFTNTLKYKKEYNALIKEELASMDYPRQLSLLKQKETYYDSVLSIHQLKGGSIQNGLLRSINSFADENGLKVTNFLEPHISTVNDLTIKTYQFTLDGEYNAIIALIHRLEQGTKYGEIINLQIIKQTNFRTSKSFLQAVVFLKSFG